jgi:energy-coupling factor transporter ATP-binding protein EcfA2
MNPALLSWLNEQTSWLRVAAGRLIRNGVLTEADITDFVALIKEPPRAGRDTQAERLTIPPTAPEAELRLLALGPVAGIDALSPRSPLGFGTGNLSVIYGHNGSGKTGYTRIIAKACGKPHANDLRVNVFAPPVERQLCKIKYSIGGVETEIEWSPPTPIAALATLDIFDSNSGKIYLESETEATFLPPELALLADLVVTCGKIQARLDAEERALASRLPTIGAQHAETAAAIDYGRLRHDWTEQQVAVATAWSEQHAQELVQLNATLAITNPAVAAQKQRGVKQQRESLAKALEDAMNQLRGEDLERIRRLFSAANDKRRAATEAAEILRNSSTVNGVGSSTWRAMWSAAREFAIKEAHPDTPFPSVGTTARCIFCQQELDDDARERLTNFESFVAGRVETEAKNAEAALERSLKTVIRRPVSFTLQTAAQAADLNQEQSETLDLAWAELECHLRPLREGQCPEADTHPSAPLNEILETLRRLAVDAENEAARLLDSANPEARQTAEARRKELLAQKWVSEQAAPIRAEIVRMQQVQSCQAWKRQTVTTGLSRKANELSEELVTEAYINRFNNELRQLGASNISVELTKTRAERGRIKHGIRLRNAVVQGARISDILSEGERRIISLAAFLADVTGRIVTSPFIFDDPISSLDHTWEERTIDRLIALSETRQVIVFTHRLSLLGVITDRAPTNPHTVHIRRETWGTGQPGVVPIFAKAPDGVLRNLKNDRLVRARRAFDNEGHEVYYPLGKAICGDIRILTERLVELVLLSGVVQRHSRELKTRNIIHQLAKIRPDDCLLIEEFMDKYSRHEHSQSTEAPIELPQPDELAADIDRLLDWHDEFKTRAVT